MINENDQTKVYYHNNVLASPFQNYPMLRDNPVRSYIFPSDNGLSIDCGCFSCYTCRRIKPEGLDNFPT